MRKPDGAIERANLQWDPQDKRRQIRPKEKVRREEIGAKWRIVGGVMKNRCNTKRLENAFALRSNRNGQKYAGLLNEKLTQEVTTELEAVARDEFSRRRKKGKWAYYMFFGTFIMICYWAVRPLTNLAIYGESTLIVHSWVPFSRDSLIGFFGNYIFQIVPCLSFCLGFCLFASIFVSFSEMLLGHFAMLGKKLSSMDYGKEPIDSKLANCIDHHTRLLKICSMFQDITSVPLLTQCIFTVLALCMAMFELSDVKGASSGRLISVFAEAQQELLFLATYCWYGNEITIQCLELIRPGYMTNWYEGSRSEKRTLLNMMTRTLKPINLGGFIKMDTLTFINVMKAAFSYYSFLAVVAAVNAGG